MNIHFLSFTLPSFPTPALPIHFFLYSSSLSFSFSFFSLLPLSLSLPFPFVSSPLPQAVKSIPKPALPRLDPNDPNLVIGIPPEPPPSSSTDKDTKENKKVCNAIFILPA